MPNKRKICAEHNNSSQSIFIPTLNSWYPIENVINSAYRKVLDFKENAEKILEKEKNEALPLGEFSKAILDSRSFHISLQHQCIVLKCYITLEKDKDIKKKRNDSLHSPGATNTNNNGSPLTPQSSNQYSNSSPFERARLDSSASLHSDYNNNDLLQQALSSSCSNTQISSGGAKKVNVEVIMKSNPFRVDENEKTTRMELIRASNENGMLRFTYYVKPEFEARKINKDSQSTEIFENGKLILFTNDFFTVHQTKSADENMQLQISLNEIVQSLEEQKRTEALGEKLCILLKDRPRHRALLTNECKLNTHNYPNLSGVHAEGGQQQQVSSQSSQEDETYYTRELINIYGQPIVPSFHKYFNYQLSNTHYGYRTLRRLLNCDILKKYVKITKEEIKSLDRVVEFVQLTNDKCLSAFQVNLTTFYDPIRFENGIVKDWLDTWYVGCLKEMYMNETSFNKELLYSTLTSTTTPTSSLIPFSPFNSQFSNNNSQKDTCFLQTSHLDFENIQCDQSNHLWFCLQDYACRTMTDFLLKLEDYIDVKHNNSELILVRTLHPIFEYKDILVEARRILAVSLNKSITNITLNEIISNQIPVVAHQHVESLLNKYINFDSNKRIVNYTALFDILLILKRELCKEKNDDMKYSHFLCTLERSNQEKLKLAITQLKCVPCLNKFTTNYSITTPTLQQLSNNSMQSNTPVTPSSNKAALMLQQQNAKLNLVSHTNMNRLLKQMSLIVSTELQQIAIDLIEKQEDDKIVKYIRLKDEFKQVQSSLHSSQSTPSGLCSTPTSVQTQASVGASSSSSQYRTPSTQSIYKTKSFIAESSGLLSTPSLPISHTTSVLSQYQQVQHQQQQEGMTKLNVKTSNSSNNLLARQTSTPMMSYQQQQQQQQSNNNASVYKLQEELSRMNVAMLQKRIDFLTKSEEANRKGMNPDSFDQKQYSIYQHLSRNK